MLAKRIIPCLDIRDGQTVKGVNFINIRHAGDPVELGAAYAEQGADELVYLDITASVEKRRTFAGLVEKVARTLTIPFTVGGGIRNEDDVARLLDAGADKISINTAAVNNPDLVEILARRFGSQCIVVAIDTKHTETGDIVYIHGGRTPTERITRDWAMEIVDRGAGEILLTSMDHDGTKNGFALKIIRELAENLPIPVIASGGAGTRNHFLDVFNEGKADAALAASVFHFGEIPIPDLKRYLRENKIEVRL
ncbi:imidazole glycerol phosphate synthase subunit HisF [bacterium]|nr:imidazole glycerol phosphate synthase subunit HisF [bacterium]MBU1064535.1 imidazole glycerol phosphate synthase subunit HisF [bacterium]MBU1633427.1 imidazole glycerol phosphate synthase subunit HisF [bacterium]MBU1873357.1 imidazole glycerol phosphate synthase subunit HisF [bacterium]